MRVGTALATREFDHDELVCGIIIEVVVCAAATVVVEE